MATTDRRRINVHALQVGTFAASTGEVTFGPDDIEQLANSYDPAVYTAPVVLGHPRHDDPAWGEVLAAEARPDGLWLTLEVVPELVELLRQRRYGERSIAAWPPGAPGSPRPSGWYLKHLGFLGAMAPAVKGLQPLRLLEAAAEASAVEVTVTEVRMSETKQAPPSADTAAAAVALAEREGRLAELERRLRERERQLARREYEARLQEHVRAARILADHVPVLVALMERLGETTVELAEGQVGAVAALERFVGTLPPRVPLGEAAPRSVQPPARSPRLEVPDGYTVDGRSAQIWSRAHELMAAGGLDLIGAARVAEREIGGQA